jgi:hypothetical protein
MAIERDFSKSIVATAKRKATGRMTGKDYRKEYKELISKQDALNAKIKARLLELCQQHPNAIISTMGDTDIKAKSIASVNYIRGIEPVACIMCIEKIEDWLSAQSPVQQGKLDLK